MFRSWRKQLGLLTMVAMTFVSLVPVVQGASAPNIVTYQGRVLNANGVPVADASLSMSFALYTAVTGGSCVWSNSSASCATTTARSVTLTTGLFTENLGDTGNSYAAISDAIFGDNAALYLEVIIAGETLSPRRMITAAPYALNADTLDGIDSTTLQLFEVGTNGSYEDDVASIIGADVAFTYGSGGVGDLRVADELEVMGDGYIDNDLVVGASTSSTETIANVAFALGGNDLFVAGDVGVEGTIYTDGSVDVVGGVTIGGDLTVTGDDLTMGTNTLGALLVADGTNFNPVVLSGDATISATGVLTIAANAVALSTDTTGNYVATIADAGSGDLTILGSGSENAAITIDITDDSLDFTELSDTLALDASTSITLDGAEALTFTNSGTGNIIINLSSTGDFVVQDDGTAIFTVTDAGIQEFAATAGGIDLAGTKLELDVDNDTSIIASTDDQIDIEIGGVAQTLIMRDPLGADDASSVINPILEINYATPADTTGTNIHSGILVDIDVGNATGGTNRISAITIESMTGDAQVTELHALRIDAFTGSASVNETAINIATGWDAAIYLEGTSPNFWVADGALLTIEDPSGNDIFALRDVSAAGNHILTIDSDTALAFNSNADTDIDLTTTTNQRLLIQPAGTGDTRFGIDADSVVEMVALEAPGVDMVSISNMGFPVTTNDVNALSIGHSVSNASGAAVEITPAFAGGDTNALVYRGLLLNQFSPTNAAGTDTVIGVEIGVLTDPGSSIVSVGMQFSEGWDTQILFNDTSTSIKVSDGGSIGFQDTEGNTLMTIADAGTSGSLSIDTITSSSATINLYDNTTTKTIDIGGVTADATDTINIATNATSGDIISIGNSHVDTVASIKGGNDWNINTAGVATFTYASSGEFALCHATNGAGTEAITDCAGGPTADYAEQYSVAPGIEFGDIVVPGSLSVTTTEGDTIAQLVKSSQAYQGPVVGIVSDNYGDFTSAGYNINEEDNPMPVALVGRVPVKVTNEGGSIFVGDYLTTSSTAGAAMKATKVGRVIGMALEDWDGVSTTVMVQVNNSWSMGDVLGTDGTSTLVTDNVIVSSVKAATATKQTFDSYGLSLRGSAWDGSQAQAVEMMLKNVVDDEDTYRLSVRNTTETEVAYITNEGTMKIAGDMVIGGRLYPSDRGTPQTDKYIYYDGSTGPGGDFMRTNAKGWSTGSYDFAEMFPSGQKLTSGDVVVFAGTGEAVQRATGAQGEQLAGIVSTRPGFLAGENVAGAYPIALAGRVPTKVSTANGAIAVGDPLTASTTSGVAMKATEAGQIIGYALEHYTGSESDNLILAYVNVGYWSGGPQTITIVQNQASQAPSDAQSFSALNMSGNIYMTTHQILSIGRLEGVSGIWSIESDGTIKTQGSIKTITESYQGTKVETMAVTSPESVITLTGTATLSGGRAEVRFEDVMPEYNDVISAIAPIRVIVTPSGPVSLYVSQKDQNHFVVERFVGSSDVEFDWMVTGYRKGFEPEEETTISVIPSEVDSGAEGSQSEEIESSGDPSSTDETRQDDTDAQEPANEEPVAEEEPASPESPDTTQVDSPAGQFMPGPASPDAIEDDGGQAAEPSDVVIETPSTPDS